jgi:hypothetical protein
MNKVGQLQEPNTPAPRIYGYTLKPGVHIRNQGITQLPRTVVTLGNLAPTQGLPPFKSVIAPSTVEMYTADDERDILYPPDPVDATYMASGPREIPVHPALLARRSGPIEGVDLKFPTSGTHEQRQLSLECTKQGYGKCPWCKPAPDQREPSIKQ